MQMGGLHDVKGTELLAFPPTNVLPEVFFHVSPQPQGFALKMSIITPGDRTSTLLSVIDMRYEPCFG